MRRTRLFSIAPSVFLAAVCLAGAGILTGAYFVESSRATDLLSLQVPHTRTSAADCGATSLYIISRIAEIDRDVSLAELRSATRTTHQGTNMYELKRTAEQLGFQVEAYRYSFDELARVLESERHGYAILYLDTAHFVAAIPSPAASHLRLIDPTWGIFDVSEEQLANRFHWSGVALNLTLAR